MLFGFVLLYRNISLDKLQKYQVENIYLYSSEYKKIQIQLCHESQIKTKREKKIIRKQQNAK